MGPRSHVVLRRSVVDFLQGKIGIPYGGFPEPFRSRVLKDKEVLGLVCLSIPRSPVRQHSNPCALSNTIGVVRTAGISHFAHPFSACRCFAEGGGPTRRQHAGREHQGETSLDSSGLQQTSDDLPLRDQ